MSYDLHSRRVLVTGASAGIGRAIALEFATQGARLAVTGRDDAALEQLAREVVECGAPAPVVTALDLTSPDAPDRLARDATAGLGGVDVVVNNAGAAYPLTSPFDDATWDLSFALNFTAPRRLAELLLPAMVERRWGRVVNITSSGVTPGLNAAGPAKAALNSWARSRAFEVASAAVTINCVAPGRILSAQIPDKLYPTEEAQRDFLEHYLPIGRFGEATELAQVVVFLASPAASYITGALVPVDGGLHRLAL